MPNIGDFAIGANQALTQAIGGTAHAVNAIGNIEHIKQQRIQQEQEKIKLNQMQEEEKRLDMPIYLNDMNPMFQRYPKQAEALKKNFGHLIQTDPAGQQFVKTRDLRTVKDVLGTNHDLSYEMARLGLADSHNNISKLQIDMANPKLKPEEKQAIEGQLKQLLIERGAAYDTVTSFNTKLMQEQMKAKERAELEATKQANRIDLKQTPGAREAKAKRTLWDPSTKQPVTEWDDGIFTTQDGKTVLPSNRLVPIAEPEYKPSPDKPEYKPGQALKRLSTINLALARLEGGSVIDAVMAMNLGADYQAIIGNKDPKVIEAAKARLREEADYLSQFVPKGQAKGGQQTTAGKVTLPSGEVVTDTGRTTQRGQKIYVNSKGIEGTVE